MTHGHEILHMMEGNTYENKESLIKAIIDKFGAEELFYTCSAEDLSAEELVDFLYERNKFRVIENGKFTVNTSQICDH